MASDDEINELKQSIMQVDLSIKQLIKQIYDAKSIQVLNSSNTQVNGELKQHKQLINKLALLQLECRHPMLKESLTSDLEGFRHQFECNCDSLRKANMWAKKEIQERIKNELFSSANDDDTMKTTTTEQQLTHRNTNNDKAFLVNKSTSITTNLYQITKLMSEQVEQSNTALHALVNSSGTVTETQEEFKLMGSHLVNSRTLLTKYGRREFTDKIVIILAMLFFFSCVIYVIIKRLF